MDAEAVLSLGWWKFAPRDIEDMKRFWQRDPKDIAVYNQAQLDAEIIEVLTYRGDYASVISKLKFPTAWTRFLPCPKALLKLFRRMMGVWLIESPTTSSCGPAQVPVGGRVGPKLAQFPIHLPRTEQLPVAVRFDVEFEEGLNLEWPELAAGVRVDEQSLQGVAGNLGRPTYEQAIKDLIKGRKKGES